jgi:hypothetical protein
MKVLTKKDTTGWMMNFAWTLEIILCITGILIAFSMTYIGVGGDSFESVSFSTWLIILSGCLPLFGVAIAELFKIPMVTGFLYAKSYAVKAFALFGVTFICCLTFETMLTGQESLISLRSEQIKEHQRTENIISDKIKLKDEQIIALSSLTPEEIRKNANNGIQDQLIAVNEQIDDLIQREQSLKNSMNPAEVSELKRQIASLEASKITLDENNRNNLKSLSNELKQLNADEQKELSDTNFFKGRVREQYESRREEIKTEKIVLAQNFKKDLDKVNKKITTLNNKVTNLSKPDEGLQTELTLLANQISNAQQEKSIIIKDVNKQIDASLIASQNSQIRINELNIQKAELGEELNQIREVLSSTASHSFIHRLAGLYHGVDNLADLTEDQIGDIALVFMVSIAAVVSVIGPITTYIAYSIHIETESPKKSKLTPAIRRALIDVRRRLRNPKIVKEIKEIEIEKEIIREVPVEKIIYKTVIKPEPFEVPTYVQVPVPTDARDFPEMADLNHQKVTSISSQGGI